MFALPLREINKRFTQSEMVLAAWRSQEVAAHLHRPRNGKGFVPKAQQMHQNATNPPQYKTPEGRQLRPGTPNNLPSNFYDLEGNLNLSKVTGREAFQYFAKNGIKFPVIKKAE